MKSIVCEPPLEARERVETQRTGVHDWEFLLDVPLKVIHRDPERLCRLLLIEGESGHLAASASAAPFSFDPTIGNHVHPNLHRGEATNELG